MVMKAMRAMKVVMKAVKVAAGGFASSNKNMSKARSASLKGQSRGVRKTLKKPAARTPVH